MADHEPTEDLTIEVALPINTAPITRPTIIIALWIQGKLREALQNFNLKVSVQKRINVLCEIRIEHLTDEQKSTIATTLSTIGIQYPIQGDEDDTVDFEW